jgi:hypothetical protein
MVSHVMVAASDVAASKKFCDAVRGASGVPEGKADPKLRIAGTIGFTRDRTRVGQGRAGPGVASGGRSTGDPPGGALVRLASPISPICAIHSGTKSAPFTALDPGTPYDALIGGINIDEARSMRRAMACEQLIDMRRLGMAPQRDSREELSPVSHTNLGLKVVGHGPWLRPCGRKNNAAVRLRGMLELRGMLLRGTLEPHH